ncbi:uncharacterized mitochondrial protein AtMg00750-like [Lycium barbarum]|uniref:uncharacterized mitochondrial protein AtMg00750-like n=1 Tax=Lycium barbarum TaxID=112863 RepID=UPI00293F2901|nr:uncharacterized mitochondrial protein AtMg00750-like [Lycium barbarum]
MDILKARHDSPVEGHHSENWSSAKVLECGYYWPTLYHDASLMVKSCDEFQRHKAIFRRHEMPMKYVMEVELFDMWGFDFMGHFISSGGMIYNLVAVDYVSKWVEAVTLPKNEGKSVVKSLK